LEQLGELYGELFALVRLKIEGMRRADTDCLNECAAKESALLERLRERDSLRNQLMDAVAGELGLPPRAGRTMTMTQLAGRLCESQRSGLLQAVVTLRTALLNVTQANRVAGAVSRELINHLKWVLAAVKPRPTEPNVYCGAGAFVKSGESPLLELVG
jgi:hypothetical protein